MSGDGFLHKYFLNNNQKRLHKWLHYFDIYEHHLERMRGRSPVMLEIGVSGGGSLEMWKAYLGDGCRIIGLDINPDCKKHEADGIEVFIGDQSDQKILDEIVDKYGKLDVVLDDGSHMNHHMVKTFEHLYDKMKDDGIYLIEDTHTCYWEGNRGGLRKPGTFQEFCKDRTDDLNAVHTKGALAPSEVTRSTKSISFYDSMIVFERKRQGVRQAIKTFAM